MTHRKLLFTILSFLFTLNLFAQLSPENYQLENNRLLKSADSTPRSNSILDIVIDENNTIWLGTSRGLSRSTDNGESWKNYYNTNPFGSDGIIAVAAKNGVVWASTGKTVERDGQSLSQGTGLKYSLDNGETWDSIPQPIDNENDTTIVYGINNIRALPVTVDINNIAYDIALTSDAVWISTFAGGLRKSTDMGQTWQRVLIPPDYLDEINPTDTLSFSLQPVAGAFGNENNLNHRVFSVIASNDSTIWAGTAGGINKSTDRGISWKKFNHLNQEQSISGNFVTALGFNSAENSIWGATWRAEGSTEFTSVSYSTDGGNSWNNTLLNEQVHNFGYRIYSNSSFTFGHTMAASDNGVYRTTNGGSDWIAAPIIRDSQTKVSINTTVFYSATSNAVNGINYVWTGSADGLGRLREGTKIWEGDWKVYAASNPLESSNEVYAYPNPFKPDGNKPIKFKYSTDNQTKDVTIRVFDFGMNLIRTVVQNATRTLSNESAPVDTWDGLDDKGNELPNGVYFYRIDISGNDPLFGKIIVLK